MIKECPKSEVTGKKRKSIVNLSHSEIHEAVNLTAVWYMCGTENVEMQPFKSIFEFCLNISSYVKIYFSEPSMYKSRKWSIFYRLYK